MQNMSVLTIELNIREKEFTTITLSLCRMFLLQIVRCDRASVIFGASAIVNVEYSKNHI